MFFVISIREYRSYLVKVFFSHHVTPVINEI